MKVEAQRIAIAKVMGRGLTAYHFLFQPRVHDDPQWSPAYRTRKEAQEASDKESSRWHSPVWPVEEFTNPDDAPDYLNDLNACHEMEKKLTDEEFGPGLCGHDEDRTYTGWLRHL